MTTSQETPRQPAFGRSVRVYKRVSKKPSPRKTLRGHDIADLGLHLQREKTGALEHPHHEFAGALDASW